MVIPSSMQICCCRAPSFCKAQRLLLKMVLGHWKKLKHFKWLIPHIWKRLEDHSLFRTSWMHKLSSYMLGWPCCLMNDCISLITRSLLFNLILINLDGIHRFLSPIEIKANSLPNCNTYFGFHFEVHTSLKWSTCICQFYFIKFLLGYILQTMKIGYTKNK